MQALLGNGRGISARERRSGHNPLATRVIWNTGTSYYLMSLIFELLPVAAVVAVALFAGVVLRHIKHGARAARQRRRQERLIFVGQPNSRR